MFEHLNAAMPTASLSVCLLLANYLRYIHTVQRSACGHLAELTDRFALAVRWDRTQIETDTCRLEDRQDRWTSGKLTDYASSR